MKMRSKDFFRPSLLRHRAKLIYIGRNRFANSIVIGDLIRAGRQEPLGDCELRRA
jgi:hypothetical protein